MASKATTLKLRIRKLNAAIDSNLRIRDKGINEWIDAINDPRYPNITARSMRDERERWGYRAKIVRHMCQQLREMQAELIALNKSR